VNYQELLEVTHYLYRLLDDIDTVGDMAKDNDTVYREMVERIQAKKGRVIGFNDGFRIEFKPLTGGVSR